MAGFFCGTAFVGRGTSAGFVDPDFAGLTTLALAGVATADSAAFFARGARVLPGVAGVLLAVFVGLGMCSLH